MARPKKKNPTLIEFKGTTLPVVSIFVPTLAVEALRAAAAELFGDDAFFDDDAAVLELDAVSDLDGAAQEAQAVDWPALHDLLKIHGLHLIGVRGGSEALRQSAAAAGLPGFAALKRPARGAEALKPVIEALAVPPAEDAPSDLAAAVEESPAAPPAAMPSSALPTRVIDRPLRSGQQFYARGSDLVVLAAVNAGAEVIADGSIHIYAPLRGRALAGAAGDGGARIFTTRFEAELVSIAGVYRTFDAGLPPTLSGKPVQVRLSEAEGEAGSRLSIEALSIS